jgi:ClpP class serine protease
MKTKRILAVAACLFLTACPAQADTFKHRTTQETFTGYATHKKSAGKTMVFNADLNKMAPLDLSEYEITCDEKGRRNSVMVLKLDQPEILISETVAAAVADAILKSADQGPRAIVLQIDLPGGQGTPMRMVAEAITQAVDSTGCRVAAHLPGGRYGGAFSAAAIVALACQRIYIAPTASIGAIGPMTGQAMSNEDYRKFVETYSPDTLSTFSIYAVTLAQQRKRPELLARALLDKQLTVAEVRGTDGKQALVEISQRQDNQSVVRVLAEGLSSVPSEAGSSTPPLGYGKLLSLASAEAIRWNMADKQAAALPEVMEELAVAGVPIVNVAAFANTIPRFLSAKKNLDQLLTKIQWQEDQVATLEEHLAEMEKIALTSTTTREINRTGQYETYRRGNVRIRTEAVPPNRYYNERDYSNQDIPLTDRYGRDIRSRDRDVSGSERIIAEEPSGNIQQVRLQMMTILTEMVADYQRAINLAKRWPGALPAGISVDTLQKNMNSAQTLYNGIQMRAAQGY